VTGQVTVCLQVFSVTCLSVRSSVWSQIRIKIRYDSWVSLILLYARCGVPDKLRRARPPGHPSSNFHFPHRPQCRVPSKIRVQAIVGTGGHFLIRLGSQNERDGQRDRGPEDGTMVQGIRGYEVASSKGVMHGVYLWSNGGDGATVAGGLGLGVRDPVDAISPPHLCKTVCTRAYEGDATTIKRALFCVGGPTPLSACERCVTVACRTPAGKSLMVTTYLKTRRTPLALR